VTVDERKYFKEQAVRDIPWTTSLRPTNFETTIILFAMRAIAHRPVFFPTGMAPVRDRIVAQRLHSGDTKDG
jgi:hypothetical protein